MYSIAGDVKNELSRFQKGRYPQLNWFFYPDEYFSYDSKKYLGIGMDDFEGIYTYQVPKVAEYFCLIPTLFPFRVENNVEEELSKSSEFPAVLIIGHENDYNTEEFIESLKWNMKRPIHRILKYCVSHRKIIEVFIIYPY